MWTSSSSVQAFMEALQCWWSSPSPSPSPLLQRMLESLWYLLKSEHQEHATSLLCSQMLREHLHKILANAQISNGMMGMGMAINMRMDKNRIHPIDRDVARLARDMLTLLDERAA